MWITFTHALDVLHLEHDWTIAKITKLQISHWLYWSVYLAYQVFIFCQESILKSYDEWRRLAVMTCVWCHDAAGCEQSNVTWLARSFSLLTVRWWTQWRWWRPRYCVRFVRLSVCLPVCLSVKLSRLASSGLALVQLRAEFHAWSPPVG